MHRSAGLPSTLAALALGALTMAGCASAAGGTDRGARATAASAPARAAPASAPAASATDLLRRTHELLDTALAQQAQPELWTDAAESLAQARANLLAAQQGGAPPAVVETGLATLDALHAWRALLESGGLDAATNPEPPGQDAQASGATAEQTLLAQLAQAQEHWPQASEAAIGILFASGRNAEASETLAAGLRRWPDRAPLHALARRWRDAIADQRASIILLESLRATAGGEGAAAAPSTPSGREARIAATQGHLALSLGLRQEAEGNLAAAADSYEEGARFLQQALAAGPIEVSEWELGLRRADCLVNAGRLRHDLALTTLAAEGLAAAEPALLAAERDYAEALEAVPGDADATVGLALNADSWYQAGSLEGVREAFGRIARRFDNADWWNNYAFFCRETGQYEQSYAAYEKCIALAPDNARYVNDTGLILLYHLERDLGHAEELFRRARELGKKVCDNPFASDEAHAENLSAYGDALLNLGRLYALRGDYAQAAAFADELLQADPERPDAQELKAELEAARRPPASLEES